MSLESTDLSNFSTMVSPKQLDFSSSGGVGDSDAVTLSRRKSPRTPSSKRTAPPEVTEAEVDTKKKKQKMNDKKKKKKKETISNEEDEVTILKRLIDFRAKTGLGNKIDWDEYYRFLGVSIVEKYSKDQVFSKIRKMRKNYVVQMEKIIQRNDPNFTRCSDSEIFGYSDMIWGQHEADTDKEMVKDNGAGTDNAAAQQEHRSENGEEVKENEEPHDEQLNDNEAVTENGVARQEQRRESDKEILKEQEGEPHDEQLNDNEAVTENGVARQEQRIDSDEETLKEREEEPHDEQLNENRAAEVTETTDGEEAHGDDDEFIVVQDAYETLMPQGFSGYQKKLHLEKLLNIGTDKRRELSDGWNDFCAEKRRLNLKKLRYSVKLAEALSDS